MFARRKAEPPAVARTVWADKTQALLDDVRKRRTEIVRKLDDEERAAKDMCNHTYPNGVSAIEQSFDEDYEPYTRCTVCGR